MSSEEGYTNGPQPAQPSPQPEPYAPPQPVEPSPQPQYAPSPQPQYMSAPTDYPPPAYPPPVAYQPPAMPAANYDRNWMGIAALVFGVIGGIVLAVIFGVFSLVANRNGRANNRGLAIGALAAAGAWVLLFAAFIGVTVLSGKADAISFSEASVGDCFTSDVSTLGDPNALDQGFYSFSKCDDSTNGIIYYITAVPADATFTDPTLGDKMWDACTTDTALAVVDPEAAADYYIEYYVADEDSFNAGNHQVLCGLSTSGALDYAVAPGVTPHTVG